ncbi:uncharacterized protein [Hyperolius riggenbachi]
MASQIKVSSSIGNKDSRNSENDLSVMTPEITKHNPLIHFNERTADKKSSVVSHLRTASAIKMQNGDDTFPQLDFQDSFSSLFSDSEYDRTGGYESGVAEDRKYLCKECKRLFKKAGKMKKFTKETPKKPGPGHWCSKFWMMVNCIPSQLESKRMKKHQIRSLENVMKKLKSRKQRASPQASPQVRCSRNHSFLKRNFQACTKKKKLLCNLKSPQKREKPGSTCKKRKDCRLFSQRKKQGYVFALDSSDEEDAQLNVKRYKVTGEGMEKERLQRYGDISMASDNTTKHHNSPDSPSMLHSSAMQDKEHATRLPTFHSNPQHSNRRFREELSNSAAHVHYPSFRETLERINFEYLRSGIVNENRL